MEVEKTEDNEFYKKAFNEFLDPLAYTHFTTEVPGLVKLYLFVFIIFMRRNIHDETDVLNRVRWNSGASSTFQEWHLLAMRR